MIGETFSHYRIVEVLGAGGMGAVYRAEDLRLQRPVAIKVLATDLLDQPEALEWFKREARVAAALNHPNISTIHDVFDHEGRPFIVMELLEGRSLREELRAGPLPTERLLALATGVAEALEAAHAQRVIHRDLKPANIFVSPDGRHAKVLDFGLAQLLGDGSRPGQPSAVSTVVTTPSVPTLTRVGAGTPAYVSPEQALGQPLDERTDLFSFGAVLYEMATGPARLPGRHSRRGLRRDPPRHARGSRRASTRPAGRSRDRDPAAAGEGPGRPLPDERRARFGPAPDQAPHARRLLAHAADRERVAPAAAGGLAPRGTARPDPGPPRARGGSGLRAAAALPGADGHAHASATRCCSRSSRTTPATRSST